MQNLVQIESVFSFATCFVSADNRVHSIATCLVTTNNREQTRRQYYAKGTFVQNVEQNLNFLGHFNKNLGKNIIFWQFCKHFRRKVESFDHFLKIKL